MEAFLSVSLWIVLATVVPGLVTIAALYGAYNVLNPGFLQPYVSRLQSTSDWLWASLAIAIMVLTQALGILLEGILVRKRWLTPEGRESRKITIAEGIDPHNPHRETEVTLKPYYEYQGIYILLAELRENEDAQGHLKRALAQFFLTNNTLVSFIAGIVATLSIVIIESTIKPSLGLAVKGAFCITALIVCFIVSFKVARIRFEVMAKALWATRRRRISTQPDSD